MRYRIIPGNFFTSVINHALFLLSNHDSSRSKICCQACSFLRIAKRAGPCKAGVLHCSHSLERIFLAVPDNAPTRAPTSSRKAIYPPPPLGPSNAAS